VQQRQRDRSVDLRHIRVVDFFPVIADLVVIGIIERDAQRVRGDADVGQGLIIAAREIGVAGLFVFVDLDASDFSSVGEDSWELGKIETGNRSGADLRAVRRVGAADLIQVQIGDGFFERYQRMAAVISRADQPSLLAEESHKEDASGRMLFERGDRAGDLDDRYGSAAVVIRAVENLVVTGGACAQVIVVRG